jgi:hypothetical protein
MAPPTDPFIDAHVPQRESEPPLSQFTTTPLSDYGHTEQRPPTRGASETFFQESDPAMACSTEADDASTTAS